MRTIKKFGAGVAGVLVAGTVAMTGMGLFSGSADASTPKMGGTTVSIADGSCNSGAHGVIAVNALNCNNIAVGNDLVDVVGIGANSSSNGGEKKDHQSSPSQNGTSSGNGSSVTYKDNSCNSGAHGVVAVNALNCNNIAIGNDLVDAVGIGLNAN